MYKELLSLFQINKGIEHVEMEMRLGKHNGRMFDTNVGKEAFTRIMRGLQKYTGWEKVSQHTTDVYYMDATGVRLTVDEDGNQTLVKKVPIVKKDIKTQVGVPYDVRFSIAQELPSSDMPEEWDRKKIKVRHSFVRKNLSIDMTVFKGDAEDKDSEEEETYQVEFEIVNPSSVKDEYEFANIVHKVEDVFKLLVPIK